jgi:hypothetical protein
MRASLIPNAIAISIHSGIPLFIWGTRGTGKSSIVKSTCRSMGRTMIDKRCSQMEAVEAGGLPYVKDGLTAYAVPHWLPRTPKQVLFLDEFPQSQAMTMNALSELILDRTMGGAEHYSAPADMGIIAAGNQRSDKCATNELPNHIKNRFIHTTLELDPADWATGNLHGFPVSEVNMDVPTQDDIEWGRQIVTAFMRLRPTLLSVFTAAEMNMNASPSPRTWDFVQRILPYVRHRGDMMLEMVSGCVGEGPAVECVAAIQVMSGMPNPDDCLANPATARIPNCNESSAPAITYALCAALASKVSLKNANNFFEYLARLPQEFAHVAARDALGKDAKIVMCDKGRTWMANHSKYVISSTSR